MIRFNLAILPKSKSTYVTILIIALLAFGYVCWKNGVPQTQHEWLIMLISSLIAGLLAMLVGVVFSMITILLMSSTKNGVLGQHEYTITSEGLHEITSANEGLSKWSGVNDVKVVGSYLLFQVSGYLFHIVPARSFNSEESFNEFVTISIEHWNNAHDKSVK